MSSPSTHLNPLSVSTISCWRASCTSYRQLKFKVFQLEITSYGWLSFLGFFIFYLLIFLQLACKNFHFIFVSWYIYISVYMFTCVHAYEGQRSSLESFLIAFHFFIIFLNLKFSHSISRVGQRVPGILRASFPQPWDDGHPLLWLTFYEASGGLNLGPQAYSPSNSSAGPSPQPHL